MSHAPAALSHPIDLVPPDIIAYRNGNIGIDYVNSFDSGKPGPHVMLQALTHGNELCGAIALDYLMRENLRPRAGRLTLAFANVAAYQRWDPADPDRSRYVDEDYNRVWSDDALRGTRDSVELRRARELAALVDSVDFLLDIHSMREPCSPIMVCGAGGHGGEKSAAFSRRLGMPTHLLIDTGHPAGLRMIERGGFGDPASPRTALLIECGQHWALASVGVAIQTSLRFLHTTGAIDDQFAAARLNPLSDAPQATIRVTHAVVAKSLAFRFAAEFAGLQVVAKAGTPIAFDGDETISAPYDNTVLVMPSMAHLTVGNTMVRLGRFEH